MNGVEAENECVKEHGSLSTLASSFSSSRELIGYGLQMLQTYPLAELTLIGISVQESGNWGWDGNSGMSEDEFATLTSGLSTTNDDGLNCVTLDMTKIGHNPDTFTDFSTLLSKVHCTTNNAGNGKQFRYGCSKPLDVAIVEVSAPATMHLETVFNADLNNPETDAYIALATQMETEISSLVVAIDTSLERVVINGFSEGSVVCDYDVVFSLPAKGVENTNVTETAENSLDSLFNAIKAAGEIGGFPVDNSTLVAGEISEATKCAGTEFACEVSKTCLPEGYKCDGIVDCADGSDELSCVNSTSYESRIVSGCGGAILKNGESSATISHLDYPNHYGSNQLCTWSLDSPSGVNILLDFHEFNLEYQLNCGDGDAFYIELENTRISLCGYMFSRNFESKRVLIPSMRRVLLSVW